MYFLGSQRKRLYSHPFKAQKGIPDPPVPEQICHIFTDKSGHAANASVSVVTVTVTVHLGTKSLLRTKFSKLYQKSLTPSRGYRLYFRTFLFLFFTQIHKFFPSRLPPDFFIRSAGTKPLKNSPNCGKISLIQRAKVRQICKEI